MKLHKIIDLRFILTPFATAHWTVKGVSRTYVYLFGVKIIDLGRK